MLVTITTCMSQWPRTISGRDYHESGKKRKLFIRHCESGKESEQSYIARKNCMEVLQQPVKVELMSTTGFALRFALLCQSVSEGA